MNILFITGNKHKLREAKEILGDSVEGLKLDLLEIQSLDPKEIIEEKLREARKQIGKHDAIIMVEDVSFWIGDTGLPGPFIKFFNETIGPEGGVRFAKAFKTDKARAECNIGILIPGEEETHFFTGTVPGTIVEKRGESGFGFDPIFVPEGETETFAEMAPEKKNSLSHRKRALEQVEAFLAKLTI
jgi:inosine triphosphate pyrophosphatase